MNRARIGAALVAVCALAAGAGAARAMTDAQSQQAAQLMQKQDWHRLATLAAQATRADSKDGWGWYDAGLADDGLGNHAAATTAYATALPLVPSFLQGSVAQLLAQDYVTLKETDKLVALYHQLETTNPALAQALQAQFPGSIVVAAPAPVLPAGLPALAAQAMAQARRWQPDAALVAIDATLPAQGDASTQFRFYSATTQQGWTVTLMKGAWTPFAIGAAPQWRNQPLPQSFVDLPAAIAAARQGGLHDAVFDALLAAWAKPGKPGRFAWLVRPETFDPNRPIYLVDAGTGSLLDPAQWLESSADNAEMNQLIAQARAQNLARRHVTMTLDDPAMQRWVACATAVASLGRATFVAGSGWQAYQGLLIPAPDKHMMFVPLVRSPYWSFNAPRLGPSPADFQRRPFHIGDPPFAVYFYDRDEWNPDIAGADITYLTTLYTRGCQ